MDWSKVRSQLLHPDFAHREVLQSILAGSSLSESEALRVPLAVAARLLDYPTLLKEKSLRIAVLGAETLGRGADGRLFGLVPHALACTSLKLEVQLVGPQLISAPQLSTSVDGTFPAAIIHNTTCGMWWAQTPQGQRPNLLFAFYPGIEERAEQWMRSSELPRILSSGIPLIIFSYNLDEAHRDAHILEAFGAQIVAAPKILTASNSSVIDDVFNEQDTLGGATFTVSGFKKKSVRRANVEVAKVRKLVSVIEHILLKEDVLVQHADAFRPCSIRRNGKSCAVLNIISDKYFDPATAEIFEAREGDELASSCTFPAPNVAAHLPQIKSDLARSMLAAEIYSWY